MPERLIRDRLARARHTLVVRASVDAVLAGAVAAALTRVLGASAPIAVAIGAALSAVCAAMAWRHWTDRRVARYLERAHPSLQNLLVTAQEVLAGRRLHPVISGEVLAQAADRLHALAPAGWPRGTAARASLSAISVITAAIVIARAPVGAPPVDTVSATSAADPDVARSELSLRVTVTPPAYTRRPTLTLDNPMLVEALEGSTIRIRVSGTDGPVRLIEPGREARTFTRDTSGAVLDLSARDSRVFLIGPRDGDDTGIRDRLLQLHVQADEPPIVNIDRPGRDLLFGTPSGAVPIQVSARDDLNVASVSVEYTHVSGSGESFTFVEGQLPLQILPDGMAAFRQARGTLRLEQLELQDGDTVVYRAIARDDKPGADPVTSASFVIEIGRQGEASSSGYALPEDRDRQGLSQQILIIKTEKLHSARSRLDPEARLEQSRLLAVEQRMVRAEFVFMTGGEVVDEVEEAEHSHELAAGRFENAGQVELLNAIREMSRAEARLNDGDTEQALVFERAALRALERAFDRRRYFLRTMPERARIDPSRRLSGDTSGARPRAPARPDITADVQAAAFREVIAALSDTIAGRGSFDAALAARVIALAPDDVTLREAAATLSSNRPDGEKSTAAVNAQSRLTALLRERLGPAAGVRLDPPSRSNGSVSRP